MFSGGMVGRRSLQDRARPWVSRVGLPRSRSRFSTVVGSTPRCLPTRARYQPELYKRIVKIIELTPGPASNVRRCALIPLDDVPTELARLRSLAGEVGEVEVRADWWHGG